MYSKEILQIIRAKKESCLKKINGDKKDFLGYLEEIQKPSSFSNEIALLVEETDKLLGNEPPAWNKNFWEAIWYADLWEERKQQVQSLREALNDSYISDFGYDETYLYIVCSVIRDAANTGRLSKYNSFVTRLNEILRRSVRHAHMNAPYNFQAQNKILTSISQNETKAVDTQKYASSNQNDVNLKCEGVISQTDIEQLKRVLSQQYEDEIIRSQIDSAFQEYQEKLDLQLQQQSKLLDDLTVSYQELSSNFHETFGLLNKMFEAEPQLKEKYAHLLTLKMNVEIPQTQKFSDAKLMTKKGLGFATRTSTESAIKTSIDSLSLETTKESNRIQN